ncbi:GNAT family N-acetyltransferase [Defluviimonas sp. WL0024]|uniref:GNAT family N-acetyltransferase n=2 Tax=Albidovulum TaxID=205889 RepID=A0ABT3J090_9RHOB|nr:MULTISPECIES: GNAT family N-acetyltransferase [Defluviimonas]MCU9846847.1 GNAT family N-acetyltransferase [Defluviimonas sp. WL0024]MCW3781106.1 GNAT family N-acetyltransferase [Defluviimonas salinarum]
MTRPDLTIRKACAADAGFIAEMVNQAGEGIALHFWSMTAPVASAAIEVGIARAAGETAAISYRNAWIAEIGGEAAGCLIAHRQPETLPPPDPETPPLFRPLDSLEAEAPDTGYVHVLATAPAFQGRGIGTRLLDFAERYAGPRGMSLIVADANEGARRLYERAGYRVAARRAMVKDGWAGAGREWLLMVKPADHARNG